MEYAICIGFKATTNDVKYEAFLAVLRVVTELKVEFLDIYNNSQLVVNQVQGDYLVKDLWDYLAKDLQMMAYLDEVKAMSMKIKDFKIRQILRGREQESRCPD